MAIKNGRVMIMSKARSNATISRYPALRLKPEKWHYGNIKGSCNEPGVSTLCVGFKRSYEVRLKLCYFERHLLKALKTLNTSHLDCPSIL